MRIGIDFGTTRIVVAAADRGNYPLVNFEAPDGHVRDWFPPVVAWGENRRVYGWEAFDLIGKAGWTITRSLKRWLNEAGPYTQIEAGGQQAKLTTILQEMMAALRTALLASSNLGAAADEKLEAMLGVPANSSSNQRFLTEQAARAAGFDVLGISNEPSAAAIEFAYRNSADRKTRADGALLVYDLGGGTFDASLVTLGESEHFVVASDGISDLGGDDFDEILADLALDAAKIPLTERETLTDAEQFLLLDECREKKESLNPNTRKVIIDLEKVRPRWKEVSMGVDAFYERCRPLIESSRHSVENLLAAFPEYSIDTLYLTGGGSELPPVARILRETFGRRVRRSAYMRSATAIGLAIRADAQRKITLHEKFARNFGVWREADAGHNVVFDLIFARGMELPRKGDPPLQISRTYRPAHNIGHFRYLECAHLDANNQPVGDIVGWDDIRVPFDPKLRQGAADIAGHAVTRVETNGLLVEELYLCDDKGGITVRISEKSTDYVSEYRISKWSEHATAAAQAQPKSSRRSAK